MDLGGVGKEYVGIWVRASSNQTNEGVMGGENIDGEGRSILQENFHYINSIL